MNYPIQNQGDSFNLEDIADAMRNGVCTVCGGPRISRVLTINDRDVVALGCKRDEFHAQDPMPEFPADAAQGENTAFCENGSCSVLIYELQIIDGVRQQNCPGCGQFGRIKGTDKNPRT